MEQVRYKEKVNDRVIEQTLQKNWTLKHIETFCLQHLMTPFVSWCVKYETYWKKHWKHLPKVSIYEKSLHTPASVCILNLYIPSCFIISDISYTCFVVKSSVND